MSPRPTPREGSSGRKPRPRRECVHCWVWTGGDGVVLIRCSHCPASGKTIIMRDTTDDATLLEMIRQSRDQHARLCDKRIFGRAG